MAMPRRNAKGRFVKKSGKSKTKRSRRKTKTKRTKTKRARRKRGPTISAAVFKREAKKHVVALERLMARAPKRRRKKRR